MKESRVPELDLLKGLGIIMMIIGHMHINETVLNHWIYAFHMPLFFIVSGILHKKTELKTITRKRAKTLLIPYLSFGGGYWLIFNFLLLVRKGDTSQIIPTLMTLLFFPTEGIVLESSLWFLPIMYITVIVYCLLDNILERKGVLSLITLLIGFTGFILPRFMKQRLPLGLESVMVALLFYHTGRLMRDFKITERTGIYKRKRKAVFYIFYIIITCLNTYLIFMNGTVNMRLARWGNPILMLVNAVTTTTLLLILCNYAVKRAGDSFVSSLLKRISTCSIVYICANHLVIRISRFVVLKVFNNSLLYIISVFCLSIILLYSLGELFFRTRLKIFVGKINS